MLEEIKELLKKIGGRFIIVEEGRPRYVILDFEEFKILVGSNENPVQQNKDDEEKANEELADLSEEKDDEVKLEDIPLE